MVKATKKETQSYKQFVKARTPSPAVPRNAVVAFAVGGLISVYGQVVMNGFMAFGMKEQEAGRAMLAVVIFTGALLTGFGVYDRLGQFAGMGAILPISGFANAVASPALEYKREGYVFGIGARLFKVAGPVIVYGLVTATAMALIRVILGLV